MTDVAVAPDTAGGDDIEEVVPDNRLRRTLVRSLEISEDVIYLVVAVVLVVISAVLLFHTVADALSADASFAERVTSAVNGVLFVVILLEIFRTVLAHLEGGGFQLIPFLVIGIISAVRHILLIGTKSLTGEGHGLVTQTETELLVNAIVALLLVGALVLLRRHPPANDGVPN